MNRARALAAAARLGGGRHKDAAARAEFRRAAAAWDAWYAAFHRAERTDLGRLAARLARLARGGRLLEVGCGDGRLLAALAPSCREAAGADASARALALARRRLGRAAALARIESWELPFPDASFDAVVCQRTLYAMDPEAAVRLLKEMRRVLAPGGRIAFNLPNLEDPAHAARLAAGRTPWPSPTRPRYWTEGMLRALLPRLGLRILSLRKGAWLDAVVSRAPRRA